MNPILSLASNSFKEIARQPFYYIILFAGCFIMLVSFSFTFFAFGEELKMIRNMGISTITICGLLAGCLSSSILITGELERQTTLTILCKPITRTGYILGKYLGILAATTLMVVFQFMVLETALVVRKYMDISNYSTNHTNIIDFICFLGIYFAILQIAMLTSISLALSLFLNTIANITICLLFFIFCNTYSYFLPLHTNAFTTGSPITSITYAIFPDLQNLNILILNENLINQSSFLEEYHILQYIVYTSVYYAIYSASVLWLSIFFFKRKEIA
jgi:ABC-type transport system involved in multi-copper enzyme maturation permease subunit